MMNGAPGPSAVGLSSSSSRQPRHDHVPPPPLPPPPAAIAMNAPTHRQPMGTPPFEAIRPSAARRSTDADAMSREALVRSYILSTVRTYVAAPSRTTRNKMKAPGAMARPTPLDEAASAAECCCAAAAAASAIPTISVEASKTERRCMHVMMIKILEYDVRRFSMYQPVIP